MRRHPFQRDLLEGVSVANLSHPILTLHQLGGIGQVFNKALVIPCHVGKSIHSIEYVSVQPLSSVGEHTQQADEIYYILQGEGELITNGVSGLVSAGDLVIAPRSTSHSIRNLQSRGALRFLVIEVFAPLKPTHHPQVIQALPGLLRPDSEAYPSWIEQQRGVIGLAQLSLQEHFAGPWGNLTLLEVPPECRLEPYSLPAHDENLFVLTGHASIALNGHEPFQTDEDATQGLNVFVPVDLSRQITNRSRVEPLLVLSVQIHH